MHVKDISIASMVRSTDGSTVRGDVNIVLDDNDNECIMRLPCETPFSSQLRSDAALIGTAIRTLRRLPKVKTGVEKLTFEKGLRPLEKKGATNIE